MAFLIKTHSYRCFIAIIASLHVLSTLLRRKRRRRGRRRRSLLLFNTVQNTFKNGITVHLFPLERLIRIIIISKESLKKFELRKQIYTAKRRMSQMKDSVLQLEKNEERIYRRSVSFDQSSKPAKPTHF